MNIISDKFKALDYKGRSFPLLKGDVKITLKNVHNGKKEVIEGHNAPTNALADIFSGNFGGLLNYNNFSDLYETYLGGVLVFASALDPSVPANYGIPAEASNSLTAHSGRIPLTDQADDRKRGNPDNTGTVKTASSTKLVWEWGTSAGNGTIASLGLTHSDIGSYGCGINSAAQKLLSPFVSLGTISNNYSYGDNAEAVLGLNGNLAYNFYFVNDTTVDIFKTPINNTKFKLQGGALQPLTAYTSKITATLPNSYAMSDKGCCYYHFDFANNKLLLFGIATAGGNTLYKDEIDLDTGTVTHNTITVTGASLWKFCVKGGLGQDYRYFSIPTQAIIYNNYIYLYGYTSDQRIANKLYKLNLSDYSDISEVDTTAFSDFTNISGGSGYSRIGGRYTSLGGLIIQDSFIINSDKAFGVYPNSVYFYNYINYANNNSISSAVFGIANSFNTISACKAYLATKYNLDSPVTKTSAQSLTVEYTLTEV